MTVEMPCQSGWVLSLCNNIALNKRENLTCLKTEAQPTLGFFLMEKEKDKILNRKLGVKGFMKGKKTTMKYKYINA